MSRATMRNVFFGIDLEAEAPTSYEAVQVLINLYRDLLKG